MLSRKVFFFLLFLFSFSEVYSTHLVGGYSGYEYLGRVGSTNNFRYRIHFTVYRDCSSQVDFDDEITVCVFDENTRNIFKSETIVKGRDIKVDPVGNTDCPQSKSACIEVNVYEKIITLPQSSFGYRIKWERCCRNTQVNLPDGVSQGQNQPSQGQTYMTLIPPTSIVNSSPYFTEVPVPFICINDTTQIRSFAIDPDGDSLVFRFVRPWAGGDLGAAIPTCGAQPFDPTPIQYRNNNYNENRPFGPGGISSINPQTGTMTVMSNELGNFALAVEVEEYRNGILIGRVRLDLQLLVINCPPNKTPFLSTASRVFNREVLAGSQLCFNITALDNDNQNVKITGFGEIFTGGPGWSGPTATFPTSQGFKQTTSQFCWTPSCGQAKGAPYVFVVEAIDDGCPSKFLNETYYIFVRPFKSNLFITGNNPVCEGLFGTKYQVNNTVVGSTIQWTVEGGTIVGGIGTNEITVDWDYTQASGRIIANEVSANGCTDVPKTLNVTFLPRPPAPQIISVDSVCLGEEIVFSSNLPNMIYRWFMPSGAVLSTPSVSVITDSIGSFNIKHLIIDANQCPSDTATKPYVVVEPLASKIIGPITVCPNNSDIEFWVEGYPGSTFTWFIENATIMRGQGSDTIVLAFGEPTTVKIKVIETTPLGCVGDTLYLDVDVTYDLIIDEPIGERSVCEFTSRYLSVPQPYVNNTVYFWTVQGGQIDEITQDYSIFINWEEAGVGKISYFQTAFDTLNSKACVSNTVEIDVVLRPIPIADQIEGVFEVCQFSDSMTFTLNGFDSSTFFWEINGNTNIAGQGTNTIKYPTITVDTFQLRVLEISQYDCPGETIDSQFIIHPKPVTTPILGDSILCHPEFSNRVYSVTGFETSTFYWSVVGGQRRDSMLIPSTTIDWFGDQNNSISVFEQSAFGCIGDTLIYQVFIDSPAIDIRVLTVSPPPGNDRQLIVDWELINAPRYDTTFSIFKRTVLPETDFVKIGEVNGTDFTFTEQNVNTKVTPFDFQIRGHDLCRNEINSPIHTSILLTGEKPEEYTVEMNFTDYFGWHGGVMDYVVNRSLLNKTPFEEYDRVISPVRLYYENGLDHYTQCYRIKANEQEGRLEESWSNEICFNFPPLMFIPNAFSPNGNNLNDMFGVTAAAIKTFKMSVFNRWGEQLFVTTDFKLSWDGTFMGAPCEQGVYMFIVEYTSFDDTPYSTKGTFHLLR